MAFLVWVSLASFSNHSRMFRRISNRSELPEKKQQKNKSEVSSPGRKRAMKDKLTERTDKKLTHRIRQKRTKVSEVKTLLEKPDHEIAHMKLSVMHLRLLQEARERIKSKTILSGPSSSNQSNSQFGDTNSFDPFEENYEENYDNDRRENHVLENATKLNYHSYMNKQTRAKWSKSDTDLFYQGLQQFGSDFAMIQQLFPDKSRDQVRQKFKTEEKKHPMQVHDAILHRSRDTLYLKQVIKQLNIEDLQRGMSSTHKQEVASIEGDTGNEDFIEEVENGSNWSDKELGTRQSEVREGEHVSGNADDDLDLDVFDCSQFGGTDTFDPFGENYDNDRIENHVLENATKLNYYSYMNKQTRAKWSKSDTDLFYQGLQQFGSNFAMIQQLFPDKSRDQVRQKFKTEEKKHPMQVHDAILHRSRDTLYLKQVIKQLNIEDLQRGMNSAQKQEVGSIEGDTGNEDFIKEEENGSNWSDKELATRQSEAREGEHVSGNADDDLDLDVFDWY
ncbi:Transcription factor TFIIIB component B'' [Triticum urartu]|uniref:Transcription factor TFIIIB component B n=1 Tax=Triticum urartu TaxID=4572 RepID=M8A9S7_TRIUA|nr:Transcription factor TFIIIB component B'' [Triticum urartu]